MRYPNQVYSVVGGGVDNSRPWRAAAANPKRGDSLARAGLGLIYGRSTPFNSTAALHSYSCRDCCVGEGARCVPTADVSRCSKLRVRRLDVAVGTRVTPRPPHKHIGGGLAMHGEGVSCRLIGLWDLFPHSKLMGRSFQAAATSISASCRAASVCRPGSPLSERGLP
jgi:hypothetical protein